MYPGSSAHMPIAIHQLGWIAAWIDWELAYTVFPCLSECSHMITWSWRSARSKEAIIIVCLLNNISFEWKVLNERRVTSMVEIMSTWVLIQGNTVCITSCVEQIYGCTVTRLLLMWFHFRLCNCLIYVPVGPKPYSVVCMVWNTMAWNNDDPDQQSSGIYL